MEDILASGKVKAIGVCNWSIPYLEKLKKTWRIKPSVNQVELHPYLPQHELVSWCRKEGILVEAYSPLGGSGKFLLQPFAFWTHRLCCSRYWMGTILSLRHFHDITTPIVRLTFCAGAPISFDQDIVVMAQKYQVPPANILISYHVSQGVVPLVKSTSPLRLKSNLQIVKLEDNDLEKLNKLSEQPGKHKRYNTPLFGWDLGFADWYGTQE